jgi:hypothetical protein
MTAPTQTRTLHEACEALLTQYPIAASTDGNGVRSVVIRNPAGSYFVLTQNVEGGACNLFAWNHEAASAVIRPDEDSRFVSAGAASVIRHAIPIPADGTMFGWAGPRRRVTALIPLYVAYRPGNPKPSWSVMPHYRAPEATWPPFIDSGNLFCQKMWAAVAAGQLVSLGPVIGDSVDTVVWVEPRDADAPGYADVCTDVRWDGYTLPAGKYAAYQDLREGIEWPEPLEVVERYTVTDLAPRFW